MHLLLKLKLITSVTKHHMCSFMWKNDLVFILILMSVIFMQGGFVNSDIVFGSENPTQLQFCVNIEFVHSIFRFNKPAVFSFMRCIARGLDQAWSCFWGVTTSYITPVFLLLFFFFFFFQTPTLQRGFVNLDIVFGCDDTTYNPSSVQKLIFLTQFSGLTIL